MSETNKCPERLWKYRQWNEHTRRLIVDGEVHYSRVHELNDPFDCQWCVRFPVDELEQDSLIRKYCHSQWPEDSMEQRDLRYRNLKEQVWNYSRQRPSGVAQMGAQFREGVFCLAERNDDILMWSHYADFHRGVCASILPSRMTRKQFLSVQYGDDFPVIEFRDYAESNHQAFVDVARRKSRRWEYEREWRTIHYAGEVYYPGVVDQVIVGARATDDTRRELLRAVLAAGYPVQVFQAVVNDVQYKLNIRPLEASP